MKSAKGFGSRNFLLDDEDDEDGDGDDGRVVSLQKLQELFSSSLISPASLEQRVPSADSSEDYADLR
jgi:hypothetical protein